VKLYSQVQIPTSSYKAINMLLSDMADMTPGDHPDMPDMPDVPSTNMPDTPVQQVLDFLSDRDLSDEEEVERSEHEEDSVYDGNMQGKLEFYCYTGSCEFILANSPSYT
jgi:hypothetical protein